MALPMTGHRRAMTCKLEMVPPPGEIERVAVERDLRVLVGVEFRNGHMDRDCLNKASIFSMNQRRCLLLACYGVFDV